MSLESDAEALLNEIQDLMNKLYTLHLNFTSLHTNNNSIQQQIFNAVNSIISLKTKLQSAKSVLDSIIRSGGNTAVASSTLQQVKNMIADVSNKVASLTNEYQNIVNQINASLLSSAGSPASTPSSSPLQQVLQALQNGNVNEAESLVSRYSASIPPQQLSAIETVIQLLEKYNAPSVSSLLNTLLLKLQQDYSNGKISSEDVELVKGIEAITTLFPSLQSRTALYSNIIARVKQAMNSVTFGGVPGVFELAQSGTGRPMPNVQLA